MSAVEVMNNLLSELKVSVSERHISNLYTTFCMLLFFYSCRVA